MFGRGGLGSSGEIDIEQLIGFIAATGFGDQSWWAVEEIRSRVNASDTEARAASRNILRHIESGYPMPQVPLSAIQLWDSMAYNCPTYFIGYTTKSRFMNRIEQVVMSPATFKEVRDRILDTLGTLGHRLSNLNHREAYRSIRDRLRLRLMSSNVSSAASLRTLTPSPFGHDPTPNRPSSSKMAFSVPPAPIVEPIELPRPVSPPRDEATESDGFPYSAVELSRGARSDYSMRHASKVYSSTSTTIEDVKRWLYEVARFSSDGSGSSVTRKPSYNELPYIDSEGSNSGSDVDLESDTDSSVSQKVDRPNKLEDPLDDLSETPTAEVFDDLVQQGCPDLSGRVAIFLRPEQLNIELYGADTYKGELHNGVKVSVKVFPWKFATKSQDDSRVKSYEDLIGSFREWSNLGHENIHRLMGLITVQGQLGMVLEWMEYETLPQYIKANATANRCNLCLQVARGTEYLHRRKIVHGSLKAASTLVSADGVVKISNLEDSIRWSCTFVIAKPSWAKHENLRWTAPEIILNSSQLYHKSYQTDMYALGGAFFEIMTGNEPWAQCHYLASVATEIVHKSLPERVADHFPDNDIGNKVWELIVRCWSYDPVVRPSAHEVLESLQILEWIPENETLTRVPVKSKQMSSQEMFQQVVAHGCLDLSSQMDPHSYSTVAIHGGAIGDIYKGKLRNGAEIAVKVWRVSSVPEDGAKHTKRAMREIYHWSKIKHENIHELMGVVLWQGRLGMVSLWMEHGNLREYIRKYPDSNRYSLCSQVAAGVSHLHANGIIHGDLKAINILVAKDEAIKISDFDHSILFDCTLVFSDTTNIGGGTLRWMAPELLLSSEEGNAPKGRSKECDVYALGMTMLEIITGKLPYAEYKRDQGVMRALFLKVPPNQPEELRGVDKLRSEVWRLLLKCWDHDPSTRPGALDIRESLKSLAS